MSDPIRVGLIGLGRAGTGMHRKELLPRQDKFQFYAVCDLIPERCQAFHDEFGSKMYTKIEDILADPDVELIDIATRSCDHYKHAKMALLSGKDVMLEKPFARSTKETAELIALGSQPGGPKLYIRHNRRFEAGFCKVNEIIEDAAASDSLTREQLNLIHTYMRFGEDGLTIGKAGNPLTFRVVNDRLAFYMNDTEVAYLSDNKLYVTQAEILARLQIGKFAYEPQPNGNLSVIYTG